MRGDLALLTVLYIGGAIATGSGLLGIHQFVQSLVGASEEVSDASVLDEFADEFNDLCHRDEEVSTTFTHTDDEVIVIEGFTTISIEGADGVERDLDCSVDDSESVNRLEPLVDYELVRNPEEDNVQVKQSEE